ncbi:MAG TPA: FlgD immunoglobulin-like domain containing protein [Candidatus Limnocylindrales bacterium]|nr:FlgD immunoglobulin-like domain containing protein [Candidatus Limnocylindrales bacterium]
MRRSAAALAFALIAALGVIVPSVSAAAGDPKVVIIVGATHSVTASYRADADVAYAEAIKHTSNVVKVYSPNATWARVKAAVAGASVVIYFGHGNGWPSPYGNDAKYTTKDGFGLNATAGAGDYNNVYYGEPSIATLAFAPGAIVLLNHLCYASGNSEPGNPEPTVSVARQRADNYAAAFLTAGASAVIAEGHTGIESTVRALFTTHQTIENMWRTMPNQNGHVASFPSVRTPGATIYQDPTTPTTGYWRSLAIGAIGVTTDEVTSAGYGDTSLDPAKLVVPGNASVATAGAGVYGGPDTTAAPVAALPAGTRLRIVAQPSAASTVGGAALVQVQGLDDPSITGYMVATDLAARDSAPPVVRGIDAGGPVSPNGDGRAEQATITARFTESADWTLRVQDSAATVLFQRTGTGRTLLVPWDGRVAGSPVADGTYSVSLVGVDPWGNTSATVTTSVRVDTAAPTLVALTPADTVTQWFSPNGDAVRDTVAVAATNPEPGAIVAQALTAGGALVRTWSVANGTGPTTVAWDGRNTAGAYVPDGVYTLRIAAQDTAGNIGPALDRTVNVIGALRSVLASRTLFFPHDLDTLAPTTTLSFTLARPMTVNWTVRNAAGAVVVTHLTDAAQAAGTVTWVFDGRGTDGALLPRGLYTSVVTATDGTLTASQVVGFQADAFAIRASDATPGRGQWITYTVTSAETLAVNPTLFGYQPGVKAWSVRMTKVATNIYRATVRMKPAGHSGIVSIRIKGLDSLRGVQNTFQSYRLH